MGHVAFRFGVEEVLKAGVTDHGGFASVDDNPDMRKVSNEVHSLTLYLVCSP